MTTEAPELGGRAERTTGIGDCLRKCSVIGIGVLLAVLSVAGAFIGTSGFDTVRAAVPLVASLAIVAGGVRLHRTDLTGDDVIVVTTWTAATAVLFAVVLSTTALVVASNPLTVGAYAALFTAPLGAAGGTLAGYYDARRRQQHRVTRRTQRALETATDGIAILNDRGEYVTVNGAFAEMYGYDDPEELVGEPWERCYPPSEAARIEEEVFPELKSRNEWRGESTGQRVDDSTFPQELTLTRMEDGGSVAIVRDITESRERARRLATIIENVPIMLFVFEEDGTITLSEGKGLEALGLEPGEAVGDSMFEMYAGLPNVIDGIEQALDGNTVHRTVDLGTVVLEAWLTPVYENDEVTQVIGTAMDITEQHEQKRRIEDLHNASRRLTYATTTEGVAETTVDIAKDVLDCPLSMMWRYDEAADHLVAVGITDSSKDLLNVESVSDLDPIAEDDALGMEVFRAGETRVVENYRTVENRTFDGPFGAVLLIPLGDQGLLVVGRPEPGAIPEMDVRQAEILGLNARAALDRAERERELEQSRARFRALTENSPVGIVSIDESSTVQFASQAIEDILGYDPDELEGESLTTIIPEHLREQHREGIQRYLDTGERALDWSGIELPGRHADGHEVDIEVSFGELELDDSRLFTGIVRDISERKRQERQIRTLQQATLKLADTSVATEAESMAVDIAGDVLGRPFAVYWQYDSVSDALVPQQMTDEVRAFTAEHGMDGIPTIDDDSVEMRTFRAGETRIADDYQTRDGAVDMPLGTVVLAPVGDHGLLGFATLEGEAISETDRYLMNILAGNVEAALDRIEREAELETRSSQMEFINSILRHDVLNGMTVIGARAEILEEELDGDHGDYAETIRRWCDDITDFVERVQTVLNALSGQEGVTLEPVDVTRLLEAELDRIGQTYPDVEFETSLPEGLQVRADELLGDVLGNIVRNSIEHNETAGLRIHASAERVDGRVRVRIADNGRGIPAEQHEMVFRRGETHAKSSGSGFGLFFVDAMVDAYGGDIHIEDNDPGAAFVIDLQRADTTDDQRGKPGEAQ
ncbi:PAS domain S-box protein [Natronomonas halophila]|uniref:PAS domain S-box protein n=1 Tax=Natronomonas halophila TaxID=2747817 RepID=UPI0015B58FF7|nr:PAS domain S-box protein [Natronomonas halophila]QLD86086.1 PAS domain S-box protein [Natronomonas halophila]